MAGWGGARPNSGPKRRADAVPARQKRSPYPPPKTAAPREPMRISPDVLARSRGKPVPRIDPFQAPQFPPGVGGRASGGAMAFDEAVSMNAAWAGSVFNAAWWEGIGFLGYTYLAELAQRPEYRVISETLSTEATRRWMTLKSVTTENKKKAAKKEKADLPQGQDRAPPSGETVDDYEPDAEDRDKEKKIKELNDELDRLRVRDHFRVSSLHDGFFGRGHLYIDVGQDADPQELLTPIGDGRNEVTAAKVKKGMLRGLKNVEPVWCYPSNYNSNDPLAANWYKPDQWVVMAKNVHATRLLTFVGRPVPDLLKPAYAFGGLSMSQMAKPYVDNWLRTRQSVADIISAFSVFVLSTNLGETLMAGGEQLFQRADLFNNLRDNRGIMMIDQATEEFQNVAVPLGTLDALQAQTQEHLCVARGTLIETDRGQVPIEDVTPRDLVMTRSGLAPVKWVGITGRSSTFVEIKTDDSTLRVTECHPIWSATINEFVSAKNVDHSHRLLALKTVGRENMASQSHGAGGGGGRRKLDTIVTKRPVVSFIERFTRHTEVRSRSASIFITRMKTFLITLFQTLSLFPTQITCRSTVATDGIIRTIDRSARWSAFSAATDFQRDDQRSLATAPVHVKAQLGNKEVQVLAVRMAEAQSEPVYNLGVEDGFPAEFYANGILVHNCSVSRTPAVKLLGIQPKGFNASSEGELITFEDMVHAYQEQFFDDNLRVVIDFAMVNIWGKADPDIIFEWETLRELTRKEEAEVDKLEAETDQIRIDTGVLHPEEARRRVAADPGSPYASIDVEDVPDLAEEEAGGLMPGGKQPGAAGGSENGEGGGFDAAIPFVGDEFNSSDHPHAPAGSSKGGQFVSAGGTTGSEGEGKEAEKKGDPLENFQIDPSKAGQPYAPAPAFKSKKEHAAHLLTKGTTTQEMLSALKWPSISMPQMAKTLGMKLEKTKEGGVTKYKGTPLTKEEIAAAKTEKAAPKPAAAEPEAQKPLSTHINTSYGTEASVFKNSDGKQYNVVYKDSDSGQTISVKIFKDQAAAEAEAKSFAEKDKAEPASKPKPAPQATPAELAQAKKSTTLPLSSSEPDAAAEIKSFNEKYAGKTLTDPAALNQKVADFKAMKATVDAAHLKAQAKQQAAAAAAAKKEAEDYAKAMNDPEAKAHYEVLASITDGAKGAQGYLKHAEAKIAQAGLKGKIRPHEAAMIIAYSGSHYGPVNKQLRAGQITEQQWKYTKALNGALDKLPVHDGVTYRKATLTPEVAALYKPGYIVPERAFTSSSKTKGTWSGSHQYVIEGKGGRDISKLSSHPSEDEVLFKANSHFMVVKRDGNNIHLKEID